MKSWGWRIAENAPSAVFLIGLRLDWPLHELATASALLAALTLLAFRWFRQPFDTILLGVNLHFVAATTLIWAAHAAGLDALTREMIGLAGVAVIAMIAATGAALTLTTARGFIGVAGERRKSLALLAVACLGCLWSAAFIGDQFLSVGAPILALFLMRGALLRRVGAGGAAFFAPLPACGQAKDWL